MDDALRGNHTTLHALRAELPPTGRVGRAIFRRLLEERDERDEAAESPLESRLLRILRKARLPLPVAQFEVRLDGTPVARLDFAYPDRRLGMEADGFRWHSSVGKWRADVQRENRLKLLGWTLLRFTSRDLTEQPELVVQQIRVALEQRSQGSLR